MECDQYEELDGFFNNNASGVLKTEEEYETFHNNINNLAENAARYNLSNKKDLSGIDFDTQNIIYTLKYISQSFAPFSVVNLTIDDGVLNQIINYNIVIPCIQPSTYYALFVVVDTKDELTVNTRYIQTSSYDPNLYY